MRYSIAPAQNAFAKVAYFGGLLIGAFGCSGPTEPPDATMASGETDLVGVVDFSGDGSHYAHSVLLNAPGVCRSAINIARSEGCQASCIAHAEASCESQAVSQCQVALALSCTAEATASCEAESRSTCTAEASNIAIEECTMAADARYGASGTALGYLAPTAGIATAVLQEDAVLGCVVKAVAKAYASCTAEATARCVGHATTVCQTSGEAECTAQAIASCSAEAEETCVATCTVGRVEVQGMTGEARTDETSAAAAQSSSGSTIVDVP